MGAATCLDIFPGRPLDEAASPLKGMAKTNRSTLLEMSVQKMMDAHKGVILTKRRGKRVPLFIVTK